MMFFISVINAKVNLLSGIAIGIGMTMICREKCKKKGCLVTRNAPTEHEASMQGESKKIRKKDDALTCEAIRK